MGAAVEDVDYYALLGVAPEATLQEIKTAYRQRSLKVHPDRNPDNPQAATLFHELRQASEVLLDPTQRASFDALLAARNARKARFASLDNKRKVMAEDLERREKEFKKMRGEQDGKERQQKNELERLKEEGRKLREAKQAKVDGGLAGAKVEEAERKKKTVAEEEQRRRKETESRTGVIELGPLDTTLKIRWPRKTNPAIIDARTLEEHLTNIMTPMDVDIDAILGADKIPKGRANVKFKTLRAAVRFLEAKKKYDGKGHMEWMEIEADWATGVPPEALGEATTEPSTTAAEPTPAPKASSFPASMRVDSEEDRILSQLRAKERERVMEELRRQDELDAVYKTRY